MENKIDNSINEKILRFGEGLWARIREEVPGVFTTRYWHGRLLDHAMNDPEFKVDLFRFVDVLPMLKTSEQVSRHIREYLLRKDRELPVFFSAILRAASSGLSLGFGARLIHKKIGEMGALFIAGENFRKASPLLRKLHGEGFGFTVDLLGEATLSHSEADAYQNKCLEMIDLISREVSQWPDDPVLDKNHAGSIPRGNVSIKISALDPLLDPEDPSGSVSRLKNRVLPLFRLAKENRVFVNLDLEQWEYHGIIYDLFEEVATHPDFRNWPHLGIVVQAYQKSARSDLERLESLARSRGTPFTVRLVKGAYWDYEVIRSRQYGYPCPVFTEKAETDASYETLTGFLLDRAELLHPAFASHNLRSLVHALVQAEERKLPREALEIQMLYGMAEPERKSFRSKGYRVRLYTPIGELVPGMAYLVRRLLENTSNSGFLRLTYHEKEGIHSLLAPPAPSGRDSRPSAMVPGDLRTPFENTPLSDFTRDSVRRDFSRAVEQVSQSLPIWVPTVISGKESFGQSPLNRFCPSDLDLQVSSTARSGIPEGEKAVQEAMKAWPTWRDRPVEERARLLENLADLLQKDRYDLAALQTYEVAKPWKEADADVAEAVDFCRYYARQALVELTPATRGRTPGEDNRMFYQGRGPTVVIAPWNFPLAILCGMTAAALVTGNTVLIKPSGQSGAVAYEFFKRAIRAGFPKEVVHFLPGEGKEIGEYLVRHPLVAQIAFTGSKGVGLGIVEGAGVTAVGQPQVKRVVCEMGGKNAILVDDDADLDQAVAGIIQAAFGYSGQKCSACSRVIAVGDIYEPLVRRLVDAVGSIPVTPAHRPGCRIGPVVDEHSFNRLIEVIRNPGEGVVPLYVGEAPSLKGWYVPPAIFAVQDPGHRLLKEELFGPVLAVIRASDFQEGLRLAVSTEFALTGGVYSRLPGHLEEAKLKFRVGNLYLNRGITGAFVDRQPFGGFGMSGIGTKAGGPGYLLHFADPRSVTENTLRRGFAPELLL